MIKFNCKNCGQKFSVPENQAGKKGKCPKCKNILVVPTPEISDSVHLALDLPVLDDLKEHKQDNLSVTQSEGTKSAPEQELYEESESGETEEIKRKLPWPIDIFLYPASVSGLINLAIFTIIPLLITIVRFLLGRFGAVIGLPGLIVNILIGLYMGWYFTECVRDSAQGGTRAPVAFATEDLSEMWSQFQHIIGCYLIFLGPSLFYNLYADRTDIIFWSLIVYGVFFFPIGLLACIMFNSVSGLNPILLVGSILSTFFHYIGLVLLILGIILAYVLLAGIIEPDNAQQAGLAIRLLEGVLHFFFIYTGFVIAHLIGRFYWRYQEKLNWEV